ncbi:hypothetical protein ACHQM5_008368 [Ranunculus cassubicifolius]
MEDNTSSSSSSSEHINGGNTTAKAGLFEMTSLIQQLPFKRGLSKHFNGKSQSFTSLAKVKCLEDLAKPESPPLTKKMKSCKSYGGLLCETNIKKKTGTKTISKKSSSPRGSWSSSLSAAAKRNNSFLGNKPPMPPQRSNNLFNQTPLFA